MGTVTKTAFLHLRNIADVGPFLTQQNAEKLIGFYIKLPGQL